MTDQSQQVLLILVSQTVEVNTHMINQSQKALLNTANAHAQQIWEQTKKATTVTTDPNHVRYKRHVRYK